MFLKGRKERGKINCVFHHIFKSKFLFDLKAQVSFEYLLTVIFAILLVVVVTVFAISLKNIATVTESRLQDYKTKFFKQIFG